MPTGSEAFTSLGSSTSFKLGHSVKGVKARWLTPLTELTPYDQGFAKGYSDGWKKAEGECRQALEEKIKASRSHWDQLAKSLNFIPRTLIEKFREQLIHLAFESVRKILLITPVTREEIGAQVKQALDHAETGAEITVQLNPQDYELLTEEDKGALWSEDLSHLKWVPTTSVARGRSSRRVWMD
jgi:flagellar biosynthesis/type III secretory pathway protein FliH